MEFLNSEYSACADKVVNNIALEKENLMKLSPKIVDKSNILMPMVLASVIGVRLILDIGKDFGIDLIYLLTAKQGIIWDSNFGSGLFYLVIAILFGISLKEYFTNSGKKINKSILSKQGIKKLCTILALALMIHSSIDLFIDFDLGILNIWIFQVPNAIYYIFIGLFLGAFSAQLSYLK